MGLRHACGALVVAAVPVVSLLVSGLLLGGCAEKKAVAPPAMGPLALSQERANGAEGAIDTGSLHVSDAIARACGLTRAESAPKFEYDSAAIADGDRELLAAIARCVSEGALRGQTLALIGRTDPRGEDEYNLSLGESRADSVRRYLHDLGVHPDRLQATSRGEIDALGTDEGGWAKDRRVDIELATR